MNINLMKDHLEYNPVSGEFRWKNSRCRIKGGVIAGSLRSDGYRQIKFMGKLYLSHRIAWEFVNGKIPDGMEIDHVNVIKNDNRIINLRLATREDNQHNHGIRKNNSSGVKGVHWHKGIGKWQVRIMVGKNRVHLGYFSENKDAEKAAIEARELLHGKYARHK